MTVRTWTNEQLDENEELLRQLIATSNESIRTARELVASELAKHTDWDNALEQIVTERRRRELDGERAQLDNAKQLIRLLQGKLGAIGQQAGVATEEERVLLNVCHPSLGVDLKSLEM
jgi:hypothetical protein